MPLPDEIHPSATAADLEPRAALNSKPVTQQDKVPAISVKEQRQQKSRKHNSQVAQPAGIGSERGLKPRKKDYLKRRKLKKKGLLHLLDEEPEEDLEAELLQDRHKPKFGEQAEAPLKVTFSDTQAAGHRLRQCYAIPVFCMRRMTVAPHSCFMLEALALARMTWICRGLTRPK